jgi:hypothetical protein
MDISTYRRTKLERLVASSGGHAAFVKKHNLTSSRASYISQVINGYSFGEKAAEKLRQELGLPEGFFDQRSTAKEVSVEKTIREQDAYLDTILYCYKGLTDDHKDALATMANKLYSIDNPKDKIATPFSSISGSDFATSSATSKGNNDDRQRNPHKGAQKSHGN